MNLCICYFLHTLLVSVWSSFTESLGNNFTVQVNEAANGVRTRTMIQVLDRHDGSYLVRYKLWQGYHSVVISVLYNGQHVAASPYTLSGISAVRILIVKMYCVSTNDPSYFIRKLVRMCYWEIRQLKAGLLFHDFALSYKTDNHDSHIFSPKDGVIALPNYS